MKKKKISSIILICDGCGEESSTEKSIYKCPICSKEICVKCYTNPYSIFDSDSDFDLYESEIEFYDKKVDACRVCRECYDLIEETYEEILCFTRDRYSQMLVKKKQKKAGKRGVK